HTAMNLGVVVLAWDDALRGARIADNGENLVLHEFAHQLDNDDYAADGTPPLDSDLSRSWSRVLTPEYDALRRAKESGTPTLINQYGATNPAEFFAVVTELFFERPSEFRDAHAALYDILRSFYRQDPAAWPGGRSGSAT
ncbi:MAG: zinc-dependent peptidase, partial [Gemmatimonadaceae bacterium]